jgi:hypothetical protein
MSDNATSRPSTPGLIADALSQITLLFQTEIRLLRSELSQKITQAFTSLAVLGVSAVLLLAALILILEGLVDVLVFYGWQPFLANFLVGVIVAIIGGIAIAMAKKGLSASNLAPSRTIHQLGKDAEVAKEQVK